MRQQLATALDGSKLIVYISGPMSGLPNCNREAFHAVHALLETLDNVDKIINPAILPPDWSWERCMEYDLAALKEATHVIMLPGYENSKGAMMEYELAKTLNLTIIAMEQLP